MLCCALPWGISVALLGAWCVDLPVQGGSAYAASLRHSCALPTRMKMHAILVHILLCLFGFLPHVEAVVKTPDAVVKQHVMPLEASDLPISEDEKERSRLARSNMDLWNWLGRCVALLILALAL
jgi:hypothetical protein